MDGVAYAPHLPIDVKAWGVDWYGFSVYKTWGPHMAALYGSHAAFEELKVDNCAFSSTLLSWVWVCVRMCIHCHAVLYHTANMYTVTILNAHFFKLSSVLFPFSSSS